MEPRLRALMQQTSREFDMRRGTVVRIALVLIAFGIAALWVFWPPHVAAQFGTVVILSVSMIVIGIGMMLLWFIWYEIRKCRNTWRDFICYFGFRVALTPEGREGTEAAVREVLSRMVATLKEKFAQQETLAGDLKAGNYENYLDLTPAGPDGTPVPLPGVNILSIMERKLLELTVGINECKREFHRAVDTATSNWLIHPYSYQMFTHRYEDYDVTNQEKR